jgi:hypothetical protein
MPGAAPAQRARAPAVFEQVHELRGARALRAVGGQPGGRRRRSVARAGRARQESGVAGVRGAEELAFDGAPGARYVFYWNTIFPHTTTPERPDKNSLSYILILL